MNVDTKDREIACLASRSMQRFPSQQACATRTSHLHFRCSEISWTIDCKYGERPSHAPISLTPFWASLSAHWNSFWSTSISIFETATTYKLTVFTPNCFCILKDSSCPHLPIWEIPTFHFNRSVHFDRQQSSSGDYSLAHCALFYRSIVQILLSEKWARASRDRVGLD